MQQACTRSRHALLSVLASFTAASVAVASDPILEIHDSSLTSYLPSSASSVQDIRPMVGQRGMGIDGAMRAGPSFPMAIAGNPFGGEWTSAATNNGIRLDTGHYVVQETDIALPAYVPWIVGRSYNAMQETSGSAHRTSDGYQGKNWFQNSQPELVRYRVNGALGADDDNDLIYLVYGADRFAEYKRFVPTSGSSEDFRGVNGAAGVLEFTAGSTGEPDTYTLHDQRGWQWTFFGWDDDASPAEGQLWKIEDSAGNVAYVGDSTTGSTAISNGFNSSGYITKAFDSSDRRFSYTYTTLDSVDRLTEVKAETKTGGTWASPTGLATVGEVDYGYYTNESYGDAGDLELVTITTPLTDSGVNSTRRKYYRYWEGTYNASTNPGHPHSLKLILGFEGTRGYDWSGDSTFDQDYYTASHSTLESWADGYMEYDASYRVDLSWQNGNCGCGGGANGTHEYTYESNGSHPAGGSYDEEWIGRTIVERPDGSYETWYYDEAHQPLTRVVTSDDPSITIPSTPDRWVTYVVRDVNGQVSDVHTPANCTAYTHSSASFSHSSAVGLVRSFTRVTSGATKGFLTRTTWSEGTSGSDYYERDYTLATQGLTAGDTSVIRPVRSEERTYSELTTDGSSGERERLRARVFHSSSLVEESIEVDEPYVPTSKGGSGVSVETGRFMDITGRVLFERNGRGRITYREYDSNGQLSELIQDANTDDADVTVPTNAVGDFEDQNDGEIHRETEYAYDAQGRPTTTTLPTERVTLNYYTRLDDERLVTISYPDYNSGSGTFYGPASYTITNHAGQVEAQGTVSISGGSTTTALTGHVDETDDDPITALDLGSVVTMSTSHYSNTGGQLEETRSYFLIPASGAGTDGTNYDPTLYGYDDSGRRWRTKEAHGTIRRTVFDIHGRTTASYIGTNDSTFSGGEGSGTDNMVQTAAMEYDGGADDGNGLLTKRTAYVVDGTTNERVTTYEHDVRGNLLLQTNPEAPHQLHEYDGMGRRVATGQFSDTVNIVVGTDDPTSETSNRMGLSETFYDERGQVWKTLRHSIDQDDGSDDNSLQSRNYYNEDGQLMLVIGEQVTKTTYDGLGRATHRFTLASHNDATYSDLSNVTGDVVLEEHQTVYDPTDIDTVVMRVSIMRHEDDYGGGQTTGALDTNADGDEMVVTAGNLEGRAQITAMWYDDLDRMKDQVAYGTNGGATFTRTSLSVPTRSDTELRTTTEYNDEGDAEKVTDPMGIVTYTETDAAGRQTKVVRNYDANVNSGDPSGTDDNQTVTYGYTDGLMTTLTAKMPTGGSDQVTTYTFGTVTGAGADDSDIATGHLLYSVQYPDSSGGSDVAKYAYNAQSQQVWMQDQEGNVIETVYDTGGRQTDRKVTTLDADFDGAVRRITTAYDSLGRRDTVTQYDAATGGNVVDEVQFSYDDWGPVSKFEQDMNSEVGASGSVDDYEVSYVYTKNQDSWYTLRRSSMNLPSGSAITFSYSTSNHDDDISRVTSIRSGATILTSYDYLGVGMVVGTDYPQPDIHSLNYGSTSGTYDNLDRFNRVTTSEWETDLGTDVAFFDCDITYDRNSGITVVEDNVHVGFDVSYTNDDLGRLTRAQEGSWNGSSITSETREQTWGLDHLGNWDASELDLNGDGDFLDADELDEVRTHNDVNELTARDIDNDSTDDYTLTYDAVGNLTDDGESYEYEWDPFGRLRKVKKTSDQSLVAEYRYNGLGFRIAVHEDTDSDRDVDSNDKWFYYAYDERWRWVATFREDDSDPKEEFVAHLAGLDGLGGSSYIDLVVMRERDENTAWTAASDGTLETRRYYCQSWRADVVALVDSSGELNEWDKYSAYGVPFGLPGGDADSDGDCDSTDVTQVQTWINAGPSGYDVQGDIDLDGDVDAADKATIQAGYQGVGLGREGLSGIGRVRGWGGHPLERGACRARLRFGISDVGVWSSRDFLRYYDGFNLYQSLWGAPLALLDPSGLAACPASPIGEEFKYPWNMSFYKPGNDADPYYKLGVKGKGWNRGLIEGENLIEQDGADCGPCFFKWEAVLQFKAYSGQGNPRNAPYTWVGSGTGVVPGEALYLDTFPVQTVGGRYLTDEEGNVVVDDILVGYGIKICSSEGACDESYVDFDFFNPDTGPSVSFSRYGMSATVSRTGAFQTAYHFDIQGNVPCGEGRTVEVVIFPQKEDMDNVLGGYEFIQTHALRYVTDYSCGQCVGGGAHGVGD